ncbi:MAG: VOC family protein [Verrucomicrobia bacterium]|nr:VOC family protein [Verrucomicrobiota bacterium]
MNPSVINHIALNCRNLAAQEAFFCKHFGFERSRTFKAGQPDEFIMLKLGSVRLEMFPTDPAKTGGVNGGEQAIGFRHLAFDVPDLDSAIAALRADGIEPDAIINQDHVVPGFRIVFFRDREGNILELMQGYRDETP